MSSLNIFYVYAHYKNGEQDIPFYIGKGHSSRAFLSFARNKWWNNIANKYGYHVKILANNLFESEAFWLETQLIGMFGRSDIGKGPLVNMTNGGEGPKGRIPSKRWCQKHSLRMKGEGNPNYNKDFCGKLNPFFGRKHSEETKNQNRKAHLGKKHTIEQILKHTNRMKGTHYAAGNRWIVNKTTKETKVIKTPESLPQGWVFGRTYK